MTSDSATTSTGGLRVGGRAHPPEVIAQIPIVGTWLLIGVNFFFAVPLFFAFFFLQQANFNHAWQPAGVHPPSIALGTLSFALAAAAVGIAHSGLGDLQGQGTLARFAAPGRVSALVLVGAIVVQIWQLSHAGFGISSGAYASVFFATWVVLTIEMAVLALWVLSLANRAGYEAAHPIAMPPPDSEIEVATPISALAQSYKMFAVFAGTLILLAWVVTYFL
ncbi:MAG: hypothetical protein ACREN7_04190 [Candidatus Dormibacteria bacterium]